MKWYIPAKTFLLGEYAAIAQGSAIVLTTSPYFEISLTNDAGLVGIHPASPAGMYWLKTNITSAGLNFYDPYNGLGGLGASSAQFHGSYLARCFIENTSFIQEELLTSYYQSAWNGQGLKPSGYDVLAQGHSGCVFINQRQNIIQSYAWPFKDLSLMLVHTGIKLATHHHLQSACMPKNTKSLSQIVDRAKLAFESQNSGLLLETINEYHQQLTNLGLVAEHSREIIEQLKKYPEIRALKGCGALGSDLILIITTKDEAPLLQNKLTAKGFNIIATQAQITSSTAIKLVK